MEETNLQYIVITSIIVVVLIFIILIVVLLLSQKKIRNKQKQMLYAVMESQIAEQLRIGQDLHDQIYPDIANVVIALEKLNDKDLKRNSLQPSIEPLKELGEDIRRIAHHLAQSSLIKHGLTKAIDDFCAASEDDVYSISLLQNHNLELLPILLQHQIIQIVKELITNAKKHSKGSIIKVTIIQEDNRYKLKVQDNGIGFNKNLSEGIGLQNIKNRVTMLKGQFHITNNTTGGSSTTIIFSNPTP